MRHRGILVIDYGSQYNELVARRVRQAGVYSEICSYQQAKRELASGLVEGIHYLGGKVGPLASAEYGNTAVKVTASSPLLSGVPSSFNVFMSHRDCVIDLPEGFETLAVTSGTPNAIAADEKRRLYGVQFHPEVNDTEYGQKIIENFLFEVVKAPRDWSMSSFIDEAVESIRQEVGGGQVLLGLSGGVDSSVCAALLSRAIGRRLTCVFVDHGLLRKDEASQVVETFSALELNLRHVDASEAFFSSLKGVEDPERKRKIVGKLFIDTFNAEAAKLGQIDYLAQGTIYPDVVESGMGGNSARIKSHHNVGGLPADIGFKGLIEPLRYLFKDETRQLGLELGLPADIVFRQPFPGPGLSIRIVGEVTREKVQIVQEADAILRQEVAAAGLDRDISQYYVALTDMRTVGVKGDGRSYDYACVIRAVKTIDFMTAKPYRLPFELLTRIADRIVNEVDGINRVFFDCTSKPPATIELQ